MIDNELLEGQFPTQGEFDAVLRPVVTTNRDIASIYAQSCTMTAANYALFLTGRITRESMSANIDHAVTRVLNYIARNFTDYQQVAIGSSDLGKWLVDDNLVPVL